MLRSFPKLAFDVRKIAVLRANGIGDFIFALPALEALRSAYPRAEITLLGLPWHHELLDGRPGPVDRTVVVPRSQGIRDEPGQGESRVELDQFFDGMRQEAYDLAIQLHGGGRYSNSFVLRLGARTTIGSKTPDAAPLDKWIPYVYFQSEIMRYLEIVSLVGARPVCLEPSFQVCAEELAEARGVIPSIKKPLVVIHPGAGDPRRRWPPEKFAAVGDDVASNGAQVVVIGTEPERAVVESVISSMRSQAQNLCCQLSVGGLAGLLSLSNLVVSNDSGPLHLATAVGVPTVGIFWCGNLINSGPLTRTCHRQAVSWQIVCPVCGINCMAEDCEHTCSFVADVSSEEVLGHAKDLLTRPAKPAVRLVV